MSKLALVRDFWNETPCDGQETYAERYRFRYAKEPWLIPFLQKIAGQYHTFLEVGCGQGTDGLTLCQFLPSDARYVGVDMSATSLANAKAGTETTLLDGHVRPIFQLENAESLSFPDNSFDCVFSVGALHHSEDTAKAIAEVRRVLAPGGKAFIFLYRRLAPKLLVAHALRTFQTGVDKVLRTDRSLYRLARAAKLPENLGSAIYECFGVPILRSYTRTGMKELFAGFSSVEFSCNGVGLPPVGINRQLEAPTAKLLGYLWLAEAMK